MAASTEETTAPAGRTRRPVRRTGGVATCAVLVAVVAAGGLWWWHGTGAHLQPNGNGVSAALLPVGQPAYIAYPLSTTDGSIVIDGVHLDHPSPFVTATFFVTSGLCPIGATREIPDSCDPQPVKGATVEPGATGTLVVGYVLTAEGSANPGDVVVTYHDGLHRRSTRLGTTVCLSTTSAPACRPTPAP